MGKARYGRTSDQQYLSVDTDSAVIGLSSMLEEAVLSNGDHSDIIKFPNRQHKTYTDVTLRMGKWMKEYREREQRSVDVHGQSSGFEASMQLPNAQVQGMMGASVSHQAVTVAKKPRSEHLILDSQMLASLTIYSALSPRGSVGQKGARVLPRAFPESIDAVSQQTFHAFR